MDGKLIRSDIASFNGLLRANRWYVRKQPGDGHCLIHAISAIPRTCLIMSIIKALLMRGGNVYVRHHLFFNRYTYCYTIPLLQNIFLKRL